MAWQTSTRSIVLAMLSCALALAAARELGSGDACRNYGIGMGGSVEGTLVAEIVLLLLVGRGLGECILKGMIDAVSQLGIGNRTDRFVSVDASCRIG
ncbi:hypothetical protein [Mesorhizobium sp.]|uniref:hypothetical protein n=1 Tax=Mesorhizobium sp. TaxID=1871066 RepID=UPI0011F95C78|nr:hypothetical protein [Mesorhizobium sp.]TIO07565.1 MAG: hypothetical protein E5X88_17885 [Mesorhizobium sp.]TIO31911.1 MAG: hypothetical protein E5X89_21365 [Mesorhizobium sp.]TIP10218.1 MAG: hypothetical protein E5X73_22970 [Mesorhizobium sp.]